MLLLVSTSDVIKLVTDSSANCDVHCSWVDRASGSDTTGRTNSAIASATTTTIVSAPDSSTSRNVRLISICNRHASTSVNINVQHYDGTNTIQIFKAALPAGYSCSYNDTAGWVINDASGNRTTTPLVGRFLGSTLLTSSSGTFTTTALTNTIKIRGVAGGGGGAGCTSVAAAASAGGGGGGGGYLEKIAAVSPNTGYSYTCGAAGAGASGALGGTGGNSTFVVGGTTYTCNGGVGAPVATAVITTIAYRGGNGGAVSTNGDVNVGGNPGQMGLIYIAAGAGVSGGGGGSPFGGGGNAVIAAGNGTAATGYGAGGSGALTGASAVRTGGSGTAGCWVVEEYS